MVNSAYAKAAVQALVEWNKKSLEEAQEIVSTHSREEIEGMCWAEGSVKAGFDALVKSFRVRGIEISDSQKDELYGAILDGPEDSPLLSEIAGKVEEVDRHDVALDALTEIHDNWVADPKNMSKIHRINKENGEPTAYMHTPLEMIGWDTVHLDYIFLKPVMESMGIPIENEQELVKAYEDRQVSIFSGRQINDRDDLAKYLHDDVRNDYYPLRNYPEEDKAVFDGEQIVDQVMQKSGFENIKDRITYTHMHFLEDKYKELHRLRDEKARLEQVPTQEVGQTRDEQAQSYGEDE